MTASLLIRGARVVPVGGVAAPPEPVDVLVRDGVVAALAPRLDDTPNLVLEADGRWLLPGLWDHHVHLVQWARTLTRLDVSRTRAAGEVTARVGARLADRTDPVGPVLIGFGYRTAGWGRRPSVAELDAVSGERPVVLISGDGHNGWLNSAALSLLGVPARDTPLDEYDWFPVFARLEQLPSDSAADRRAYADAVAAAAGKGIVGVTDMEFGRGYRDWPERVTGGITALRARPATYTEHLDEVIAAGLRTGDPIPGGAGLVTMGPLKIISDGSLNTRTAYCHEPYADAADLELPRGKLNVPTDELTETMSRARAHGLQVALHAIGDAAVGAGLDAFAASGARGSIEHAQLMTAADTVRMSRLAVTASVQPAHLIDDRDVTLRCWPDRADRCFALRTLLDAGARLTFGSDAPVAPLDPWLAMAAAVHRSGDEQEPWNPAESLTPAQALAASTDGARTVGAGSPGDLVLLDSDPLAPAQDTAAAARTLRDMQVAATVLAGRPTHGSPGG
jgi:predicted amidohydrolase YtcJ